MIADMNRNVGNRRVTRMLVARSQVEGPFDKNAPVHEVQTLRALKEALTQIQSEGKKPGALLGSADVSGGNVPDLGSKKGHNIEPKKIHSSLQQFIRGVIWPDDPKGALFDTPGGTTDYSSGAKWYGEFEFGDKKDPAQLIKRSHYGDLQFFHGMATEDGQKPEDTKKKIMEWSKFLTELSTGRIDTKSKVADNAYAAGLFPKHKDKTFKELFGHGAGSDEQIRQRAAGALMHLIQDAHAKGHVDRDPVTGEIKEFHAYGQQDHDKHGHFDAWGKGKTLGDRIKNTPGAERAIEKCKQVLVMLDQGASTEEVLKFLDEQVFKLAGDAGAAGPGGEFKKEKREPLPHGKF